MQQNWRGGRAFLLAQLVRLVEQCIRSDRISITPALFLRDDLKRRLIITLNMTKVVQHIGEAIRFENTESLEPMFDKLVHLIGLGEVVLRLGRGYERRGGAGQDRPGLRQRQPTLVCVAGLILPCFPRQDRDPTFQAGENVVAAIWSPDHRTQGRD